MRLIQKINLVMHKTYLFARSQRWFQRALFCRCASRCGLCRQVLQGAPHYLTASAGGVWSEVVPTVSLAQEHPI